MMPVARCELSGMQALPTLISGGSVQADARPTTFSEALCTNRPVVLLDRAEQYPINPALAPELARRCRIVPVSFDATGRMRFDPGQLAAAITGGAGEADPGYFRRLLAGMEQTG